MECWTPSWQVRRGFRRRPATPTRVDDPVLGAVWQGIAVIRLWAVGWGTPRPRRRFPVETSTIIWIIVGIVVVIAIVVIAVLVTSRRRREAHLEAERKKAAELRQNAYESDVARRE